MVRRFAMLALSLSLLLGLTGGVLAFAQDEKKADAPKEEPKKDEAPKKDAAKEEPKKPEEPKKEEPAKDAAKEAAIQKEEPLPPIPPEVEKKLDAARRAVAEAIVAAQEAGLVKSSIDPPPILDILITGRAVDEAAVKAKTGVSPEVFGAWFTGYGKVEGITPQTDVRIINPSAGLKTWYDQRAAILNREIEAVRKALGKPAPAAEPKKEEKKEEPKKEEPKKEEPKKEEPKKEEPRAEEKKDEVKKQEPKAEEKKEEPKKEEKKDEEKK